MVLWYDLTVDRQWLRRMECYLFRCKLCPDIQCKAVAGIFCSNMYSSGAHILGPELYVFQVIEQVARVSTFS